jgi:hypothetical protein
MGFCQQKDFFPAVECHPVHRLTASGTTIKADSLGLEIPLFVGGAYNLISENPV